MTTLTLGKKAQALHVIIQRGSDWDATIEVTDDDGAPMDLTNTTATLHLGADVAWIASVNDSNFVWHRTQAQVDALSFTSDKARLVVTNTATDLSTTWAIGTVVVE